MRDGTKPRCPFWSTCGAAMVHDYWAKQTVPYGDSIKRLYHPDRDYIGTVCCNEGRFLECNHYQIRTDEVKQNETR